LWEKRAAWHQISDRPLSETKKLAPDLVVLAGDESRDEITRIHALWSLEGIHYYDEALISSLLGSSLGNLRREAVRSLASFSLSPERVARHLNGLVEDENARVRSQVLRTLADIHAANQATIEILVLACKADIPENEMGGPYERTFERYLARKALELYPQELQAYLDSVSAGDVPARNLLLASQALPKEQRETAFLELWPQVDMNVLSEQTFISIATMLDNEQIVQMVEPVIHNPGHAETYTKFALQNQSRIQSPELVRLLRVPVEKLLQSEAESEINLALNAVGRFNIEGFSGHIEPLIGNQTSEETLKLALVALENQPNENKAVFRQMFNNENLNFDTRVDALHNMVKVDAEAGSRATQRWIPELTTSQKQKLTSALSTANQGSELLMRLYDQERIDTDAFVLPSFPQIFSQSKAFLFIYTNSIALRGRIQIEGKTKPFIHFVQNRIYTNVIHVLP